MGSLAGHLAPGFGFFIIGLWHLLNHIKLHSLHPNFYTSSTWFPTTKIRYLELFLIMAGSSLSIATEHFVGPSGHHPLDPDGTIPSKHLRNFEHSSISMTFFVYATFSLLLDQIGPKAKHGLTQLLASIAFGQQLLLFHLHSSYHMGVEAQYHMLLQIPILISFITTLMGIGYPNSFMVSFVRSTSILFQGLWLMVMGVMIWTPKFVPKNCFLNLENGRHVVRCHNDAALERAKSMVNIRFSWYSMGVTIFAISFYLVLVSNYSEKFEYQSLTKLREKEDEIENGVEFYSHGKSVCAN